MGKVSPIRWIKRPEDVRQLKAGPISIVTGRNLKQSSGTSSIKQNDLPPHLRAAAREGRVALRLPSKQEDQDV